MLKMTWRHKGAWLQLYCWTRNQSLITKARQRINTNTHDVIKGATFRLLILKSDQTPRSCCKFLHSIHLLASQDFITGYNGVISLEELTFLQFISTTSKIYLNSLIWRQLHLGFVLEFFLQKTPSNILIQT